MVEAHAQSVEDYLIEGLSYKLSPGASYVTNRRSVSCFPSGSDTYSPSSGVKVIRIKVNGTDWLDPGTCKVQFDITNNHASNSIYFLVEVMHSFPDAEFYVVRRWLKIFNHTTECVSSSVFYNLRTN